jgi:hypothetical protein
MGLLDTLRNNMPCAAAGSTMCIGGHLFIQTKPGPHLSHVEPSNYEIQQHIRSEHLGKIHNKTRKEPIIVRRLQ